MVSHSAENLYVSTDKRRSVWKMALKRLNNHIFKMNLDTPHNSLRNVTGNTEVSVGNIGDFASGDELLLEHMCCVHL